MYSDNVVSLCYISSRNDKTTQLCRIADYHDGRFEAYTYDSAYDFHGNERDVLYGYAKDIPGGIGTIAVYDWSAYQDTATNEWRTSTHESEVSWIEVVSSFQDTPEQIVEMIKNGIRLSMSSSRKHDIVVCCTAKGGYADAVYIHASELICTNDVYTFSDKVITLETAKINYSSDTASCRCRYNQSDTVRYLVRPGSWHATGNVTVRSPQEIVSAAAISYARRLDKENIITRKERQSFASVIEKLSVATLSDEVAEKLGCGRNEAMFYVEECLDDLSKRMKHNEAEWVMRQLIENHSEYEQEMYEKVEALWHQEHSSARSEWTAEMEKAQKALTAVQQEVVVAHSELSAARAQKEQCEADAVAAMQLQEDIEKRIQERLAAIREERAKALVDDAWALALTESSSANTSSPKQNAACSFVYDEYTEAIEEVPWDVRWLDAVSAWTRVCGDEKRGSELAAYFFASYALKQHLVISGECAEKLADIAAHLTTGRSCVKIYAADLCTVTDLIKEIAAVPHDCICFLNGLEQNQNAIRAVMNHFNDSLFMITAPYYESLVMEPASFFTTFFPVCSEEFCVDACATDDSDRLSCKVDLRSNPLANPDTKKFRAIRAHQASWFSSGFFSPMLIGRCARLYCAMEPMLTTPLSNGQKEAKAAMLRLVYVPLMRCLRRKDVLSAQVTEFDILDGKQKKRLLAFAGVEEECAL